MLKPNNFFFLLACGNFFLRDYQQIRTAELLDRYLKVLNT